MTYVSLSLGTLATLAMLTPGCGPPGGGDAGADAPDAAVEDSPAPDVTELDAGIEDVGTSDAPDDAAADASDAPCEACPMAPECFVASGCGPMCELTPAPDGTACGVPGDMCLSGVCVTPGVGCGNGIRELTPTREGCDDGNTAGGDACSPTCTPALLVLSALEPNAGFDVAGALEGTGAVLFAWVENEPSAGERALAVRAGIVGAAGVREGAALTLDSGLGVGQAVTPVVAGLPSGWVVAWRSTSIEGTDADLGGIAYRIVRRDGSLGSIRQANSEERFDQRDPAITGNDTGFVLAWTDGSDRAGDPGLGVRARMFNGLGGSLSGELTVATTTAGDQSQPSLACGERAATWAIAYTDSSAGMPTTVLRRYDGTTPTDAAPVPLSAGWSAEPMISPLLYASTDLWGAWLVRSVDPMGQAHALFVPAGTSPDEMGAVVRGDPARRDDGVAIAGLSDTEAVLGWRTDMSPQGLRIAPIGWSLPPEGPDLESLLRGGRQRGLVFVPTARGLWLAWTDESIASTSSAVVAYLLPWD